jgi:hypothetical protein
LHDATVPLQRTVELSIFEMLQLGITADLFEYVAPAKQAAISECGCAKTDQQICNHVAHAKQQTRHGNAQSKRPAGDIAVFERVLNPVAGIGRQVRIGMDEPKNVSTGTRSAGIHLNSASAHRLYDRGSSFSRDSNAVVTAAAVHEDNFAIGRSLNETRQKLAQSDRFIQHRDDDGNAHHRRATPRN